VRTCYRTSTGDLKQEAQVFHEHGPRVQVTCLEARGARISDTLKSHTYLNTDPNVPVRPRISQEEKQEEEAAGEVGAADV
jgi:hypothetical protein